MASDLASIALSLIAGFKAEIPSPSPLVMFVLLFLGGRGRQPLGLALALVVWPVHTALAAIRVQVLRSLPDCCMLS